MESSVLGDVRVSRKAHLPPVQVGNACVKEGNTHVNGEGIQRLGGDPNRARTSLARERSRILPLSPANAPETRYETRLA